MKRATFLGTAVLAVLLGGCQRRALNDLKERVIKLENKVSELETKGVSGGAPGDDDRRKRIEALMTVFNKLEEKSYTDDSKTPKGQGSLNVVITTRDGGLAAVVDHDPEDGSVERELHVRGRRAAMAGRVRQRLLDDPVDLDRRTGLEQVDVSGGRLDPQPDGAAHPAGEVCESPGKTQLLEAGRPQP